MKLVCNFCITMDPSTLQDANPKLQPILVLKGATESRVDVKRRLKSFISLSVSEKLSILLLAGKIDENIDTISSLKVHEHII